MHVTYLLAQPHHIQQMQEVRHSVKENVLSNPALVTDEDCGNYITKRGRGWVAMYDDKVVGFAIADLECNNIWALFVRPEFEQRGIGSHLLKEMLGWYFSATKKTVWLSTAPGTRAAEFYRKQGLKYAGLYGKNEIKYEMTFDTWKMKMTNN